ncbi:MAG TPA: hypothetical protein VM077_05595 [Candidatus Limnocylindrales bacterium]|nr:hypothetical protein [Candidatus Limnocylindrales bacterium]
MDKKQRRLNLFILIALVAKAKKTDWVGFEVPKTATGLKLQYNASFFNNKNIVVDLGI